MKRANLGFRIGITALIITVLMLLILITEDHEVAAEEEIGCHSKGGCGTNDFASGVAVVGDYAYVADGDDSFVIIDISDPENPMTIGHSDHPGQGRDVAVKGDYAYVAHSSCLLIVNIINPENPISEGYHDTRAYGITVSGGYAYVTTGGGLRIVDISDPESPVYVGYCDTAGAGMDGVAVNGDYAYVADRENGLVIINISDPENPKEQGHYNTAGSAYNVAVKGDYAYVTDYNNGLVILDISNKTNPIKKGHYGIGGLSWGIVLSGDYAYVANSNGLVIVDVSDPEKPIREGHYNTAGHGKDVAVVGDFAYIADGCKADSGLFEIIEIVPKAWFDKIPQNSAIKDHVVEFEGHGTCRNDRTIQRYVWASSLDGEIHNNTETSNISTLDLSLGEHIITFKVQDNYESWSEEIESPLIIHKKPIATIENVSPNQVKYGEEVEFIGKGEDDGSIECYVWRSNIDGELYNGTNDNFTSSIIPVGRHIIYFKVRDNYNAWSDEVSTTLVVKGKPRIYLDSITPKPALDTDSITFSGHGIDDGDVVKYVWRSSKNGEFYNGTNNETTYSDLSNGTHTIYFRIQDDVGLWSDELSTILIVNGRPVARILHLVPDPVEMGELVSITGIATDDSAVIRYLWLSSLDGEIYNGTDTSFTTSDLSQGDHTIILKVLDDFGTWSYEVSTILEVIIWSDFDSLNNPTPISISSFSQYNPGIYENVVVWQDYRNDGWDIFLFDIYNSEEIQQISKTSSGMAIGQFETHMHTTPIVLKDKIYWRYEWWDFSEHHYFLYSYDLADGPHGGTEIIEFEELYSIYGLHMTENWMAWVDLDTTGGLVNPYRIYYMNLDTEKVTEFKLTGSPGIALYEDRLMYVARPKSQFIGEEKVWMIVYNLTTNRIQYNITIDGVMTNIKNAHMCGGYIVWEDSRKAENTSLFEKGNTDIYFVNLETGKLGHITMDPSTQEHPKVQGDTIIWLDKRSGVMGLYAYSISKDKIAKLCENDSNVYDAEVYGDWIVWEANSRIYLYDLEKAVWQDSSVSFSDLDYIHIPNEDPVVHITEPAAGSKVHGTIIIKGNISNMPEKRSEVFIRIDNGNWSIVPIIEFNSDGCSWQFEWDSTNFSDGNHTIHFRIYNGETWFEQVGFTFIVDNSKNEDESKDDFFLLESIVPVIIIGIIMVLGIAGLVINKKKGNVIMKSGIDKSKDRISSQQQPAQGYQNIPSNQPAHPHSGAIPQHPPQQQFVQPQPPQQFAPTPPSQHSQSSVPTPPATSIPMSAQATGNWTCPNCSSKIDGQFIFCSNCGFKRMNQ